MRKLIVFLVFTAILFAGCATTKRNDKELQGYEDESIQDMKDDYYRSEIMRDMRGVGGGPIPVK